MRENTDFINFGTYVNYEADILKKELEKSSIPVKSLYPATSIGTEAYGNASWSAYTLLIRDCDIEKAQIVKERLGIETAKKIENIPFPKSIGNKIWTKKLLIISILLFFVWVVLGSIYHSNETIGHIIDYIFLALIIVITIFEITIIIPRRQKHENK